MSETSTVVSRLGALGGVSGAALTNAAAAAVLGVVTARFLGPEGQGVLTSVTTTAALVVVLAALGTGTSLRLRADPAPRELDVAAFLGLSLVLSPFCAVATLAVVLALHPAGAGVPALLLTAALGAVAFAGRQAADLVQAFGRTAAAIVSLAVGYGVQTAMFAAAVVTGRASLTVALACAVVGGVAQVTFARWVLRDEMLARPAVLTQRWWGLVTQGYPTLGYSLGLLTIQRMDRLLLVALAGPAAAGQYAVAATVAEAARITSSATGQLLFVRASLARRVTREVRQLYLMALAVQLVALCGLAITAGWVVVLLFGPQYAQAAALVRGLVIAEFFMGTALMDSRILMGLGHLGAVSRLTMGAVGVSTAAYLVLIPTCGVDGAVLACVLCYSAYAAALLARRVRLGRRSTAARS